MTEEEEDIKIIESYKNGDDQAFQLLIKKYSASLYNFIGRMIGKNDAEDVLSLVFIKVWKNLKKFDFQKASFKTWIFSIAKNASIDFLRKKKFILFSDLENGDAENISFEETIPDEKLLPDAVLQKMQDFNLLNKSLEKLPPSARSIIMLRYQEDMSFEEIAKIFGKSSNTIKSIHRRSILKIRNFFDREE